jgi:outer membrane protein, heavy metal efflux system
MSNFAHIGQCLTLVLLAILTGCTSPAGRNPPVSAVQDSQPVSPSRADLSQLRFQDSTNPTAVQVSYQVPSAPDRPEPTVSQPVMEESVYRSDDPNDPFNGQRELSEEQLTAEVQARNPSLQAACAAWRAANERYPQAVSFEDPMFAYAVSPRGVGTGDGGGWMAEVSQKIPWAGKRALRGNAASADADAMRGDMGDVRLRLAEVARTAFYDYYLAQREMEVNASTRRLLVQFREIAWNKYQVNQTTQQDALQADVELAALESRRAELTRDEKIAVARINMLLHRRPDHPLPPPPGEMPRNDSLPPEENMLQTAARCRPDLFAAQARIRAEEANLDLACKEYYPDLNLTAKYDGFMPEEMRPQVGMELNMPLHNNRRAAAVREVSERLQQRKAEYQERWDQVQFEVQSSLVRVVQTRQVIRLYEEKILPATQRSVDSATANYTSGKLDFLRLLDAERQVYAQREMYYQAIAEYRRRLAELDRAVGEPVRTSGSTIGQQPIQ